MLRDTFDSYDVNRTGDLHLNDVLDAYYRLTNKTLQISELYNYLSTSNNSDTSKMRISFEQFCALVAEFSIDGCNTSMSDGRIFDSLYWTSTLLKTRHLFRLFVVQPINTALGIFILNKRYTSTFNPAASNVSNYIFVFSFFFGFLKVG